MSFLPAVTVEGRVGSDAEIKDFSGKKIVKLSLPVEQYDSKTKEKETVWYNCEAWEGSPCYLPMSKAKKGQKITITGLLTVRKYQKDGLDRFSLDLKANNSGWASTVVRDEVESVKSTPSAVFDAFLVMKRHYLTIHIDGLLSTSKNTLKALSASLVGAKIVCFEYQSDDLGDENDLSDEFSEHYTFPDEDDFDYAGVEGKTEVVVCTNSARKARLLLNICSAKI